MNIFFQQCLKRSKSAHERFIEIGCLKRRTRHRQQRLAAFLEPLAHRFDHLGAGQRQPAANERQDQRIRAENQRTYSRDKQIAALHERHARQMPQPTGRDRSPEQSVRL